MPPPPINTAPGKAMARLELALDRRPEGWVEPELYYSPLETAKREADKQERERRLAARRKVEEDRMAAISAAADSKRLAAERAAAEERAAYEEELMRNREAVLQWAGTSVAAK